jgi:hypothetical protein
VNLIAFGTVCKAKGNSIAKRTLTLTVGITSAVISSMSRKFQMDFEGIAETHALEFLPRTTFSGPAVELQQSFPSQVPRRQLLGRESGTAVYVIQEFVSSMVGGFWSTTASLEVLSGGRAA